MAGKAVGEPQIIEPLRLLVGRLMHWHVAVPVCRDGFGDAFVGCIAARSDRRQDILKNLSAGWMNCCGLVPVTGPSSLENSTACDMLWLASAPAKTPARSSAKRLAVAITAALARSSSRSSCCISAVSLSAEAGSRGCSSFSDMVWTSRATRRARKALMPSRWTKASTLPSTNRAGGRSSITPLMTRIDAGGGMLDDIQLDDGAAGMGHVRAHAALRTHGRAAILSRSSRFARCPGRAGSGAPGDGGVRRSSR